MRMKINRLLVVVGIILGSTYGIYYLGVFILKYFGDYPVVKFFSPTKDIIPETWVLGFLCLLLLMMLFCIGVLVWLITRWIRGED